MTARMYDVFRYCKGQKAYTFNTTSHSSCSGGLLRFRNLLLLLPGDGGVISIQDVSNVLRELLQTLLLLLSAYLHLHVLAQGINLYNRECGQRGAAGKQQPHPRTGEDISAPLQVILNSVGKVTERFSSTQKSQFALARVECEKITDKTPAGRQTSGIKGSSAVSQVCIACR